LQDVFFMLKICKCWMDVWFVMLNFLCAIERSFSRSLSNTDHRSPIRERINVNKKSDVQVYITEASWKGPAPSQCTLWMSELRLLWNHPRKALFKIKTPLWSAESTSVNIAPHDWSLLSSAAGRHRRRLWAAVTGDLTARGYCSFQVTKCDKKANLC